MAMRPAFPVQSHHPSGIDVSLGLAGMVVSDTAGRVRDGVFPRTTGALVTGTAGMTVNVAAFEGVVTRGVSQGAVLVANDGPAAVTIAAAPATNARIDVVYVRVLDSAPPNSDGSAATSLLVVQGTTAAVPVAPAVPTGGMALAQVRVASGQTSTAAMTITQVFRYTAAAGGVVPVRDAADLGGYVASNGMRAFRLDVNREFVRAGDAWHAIAGRTRFRNDGAIVASWGSPTIDVPAGESTFIQAGRYYGAATYNATYGSGYMPTINFPTAFPTAVLGIQVTPLSGGDPAVVTTEPPHIDIYSRTGFRVMYPRQGSNTYRAFMWQAVGY